MEENKEEEPEIITFKDILERHKDMNDEDLFKLVLVCKNCGHQDLLKNFLKEEDNSITFSDRDAKPFKPKPYSQPSWEPMKYRWRDKRIQPMTKSATKMMMAMATIGNKRYEDMFFCPKCGSSLVCLNPKFVKNNTARVL